MQILIVEDEMLPALDLKQMLKDLGHEVVAAVTSLDEGRRQIETAAFDPAIVDLNLRGERAAALPRLLRDKGCRFIVATGYDTKNIEKDLADCLRLNKPYDVKDLGTALRKAVAGNCE